MSSQRPLMELNMPKDPLQRNVWNGTKHIIFVYKNYCTKAQLYYIKTKTYKRVLRFVWVENKDNIIICSCIWFFKIGCLISTLPFISSLYVSLFYISFVKCSFYSQFSRSLSKGEHCHFRNRHRFKLHQTQQNYRYQGVYFESWTLVTIILVYLLQFNNNG